MVMPPTSNRDHNTTSLQRSIATRVSIRMPMLPGLRTKILSEVFVDDNAADGSSDDYHRVFYSHKLVRRNMKKH